MWEIHYSIDGVKHWTTVQALSRTGAKEKLFEEHPDRFVVVIWMEMVE